YGMIFSLFVLGLYTLFIKREQLAKLFLSLSFGLLFLFSYPPFANFLVQNLENKYQKYDYKSQVKYIHVLGSGHNTDPSQPLSSQIGSASVKRDLEGILIHKAIEGSKIIFTGYAGNTDTPTAIMNAKLAEALGVKLEDMLVNPKPKDTKEEAVFTKSIVGEEAFILVTSATHMPRAMRLFKSLGLNPIAAPTNFYKKGFSGFLKVPNIGSFQKSQIAMHEYWGILWSKLKS
ncbi:MAG: YdcF family protein, partial [Sulfurimonas sp.]|nr:YdcF family protein [Sulfurimonas sp.]